MKTPHFVRPALRIFLILTLVGCTNASPHYETSAQGQNALPGFRQHNAFGAATNLTKEMLYEYARELAIVATSSKVDTTLGNYLVDHLAGSAGKPTKPGCVSAVDAEDQLVPALRKINGLIRTDAELKALLPLVWHAERAQLAHALPNLAAVSAVADRDHTESSFLDQFYSTYGAQSVDAQTLRAQPAWTLFGFTRCIDAKLTLTTANLATLLRRNDVNSKELLGYLQGETILEEPFDTPTKIIGSLLVHIKQGGGSSLRITLNKEMTEWVERALGTLPGYTMALGCNPAYAANVNVAMTAKDTDQNRTYFDSGEDVLPAQQLHYFSNQVRFVGGDMSSPGFEGRLITDPELSDPNALARVNFNLQADAGTTISIGDSLSLKVPETGTRCNFSSDSKRNKPQLHSVLHDDATLSTFAQKLHLFYVAGLHYTAREDAQQRECLLTDFVSHTNTMRNANPDLLLHHQYVEFQNPTAEAEAFDILQKKNKAFTSLDLNATELAGLLRNVAPTFGIPADALARFVPATGKTEDILQVYPMALMLMDAFGLERLSAHAFRYDLIIRRRRAGETQEQFSQKSRDTVAHLLKSTQLAASKMALASGELKEPRDIVPFYWYTNEASVSQVLKFWYLFATQNFPLQSISLQATESSWPTLTTTRPNPSTDAYETAGELWKQIALDGFYSDGNTSVIVVPTPQYYIERGSKISLGDVRSYVPLRLELTGTESIAFGD